jgi:predicted esterase
MIRIQPTDKIVPKHRFAIWPAMAMALAFTVALGPSDHCAGKIVVLKNGMEVRGQLGKISSLGTDLYSTGGGAGGVDNQLIVFVEDGLRRVFFSTLQVASIRDEIESLELIRLRQPVQNQGPVIGTVAPLLNAPTAFDEWGRRQITMRGPRGPLKIVQGITEVTPGYLRIQALHSRPPMQWDMRLATSSIPRETLAKILLTHVDQNDSEKRLAVVRLFLQSQRYDEARAELKSAISDFPELADLNVQLTELARMHTKQKIRELKRRQRAGQHHLVWNLLEKFPAEGVAAEQLLEVREMHEAYSKQLSQIEAAHSRVGAFVGELAPGPLQDMMMAFQKELRLDLSVNTIDRLSDFERLADDEDLNNEQKLALAVTGWLTGGHGVDNLALASSLWRTRDVVQRYLFADDQTSRESLQAELSSEEANSPRHIARLLAAMKPPLAAAEPADIVERADIVEPAGDDRDESQDSKKDATADTPIANHTLEFQVEGIDGPFRYLVQLPPEYDPLRRYPTVVSLHGAGSRPELQIDWWAGAADSPRGQRQGQGQRRGQATRHGYIVVAPDWTSSGQRKYHYSAREHAAVLFTLRDAFQRFAIDTDRVFLAGHTMGGDAAWDIGLAHPDIWAGVIPIGATAAQKDKKAPKYVHLYWKNARHVSFYFVGGAKDGARQRLNARDLNRYLTRPGIDAMVVEYLGRGHESFYDDIQQVFRWMNLHQRDFDETEFEVATLRPWDNFFWWAEVDELPSRSMILPAAWPPKGAARPAEVSGVIRERKNVYLTTGAAKATIWLSPDLVDLDGDVTISVNGKTRGRNIKADVHVILEDARRRGDRQRPFWASYETGTGRRAR